MLKEYKTSRGTILPVSNLRGKEYLEVKYRIVWFVEENFDWSIETEFVDRTKDSAIAKATIKDSKGRIRSTAHKSETQKGFHDFLEKAETGAIGRALANIGYGTQFCGDELDEGERIVDSPAEPKKPKEIKPPAPPQEPIQSLPQWKNEAIVSVAQVRQLFSAIEVHMVPAEKLKATMHRIYKIDSTHDLKVWQCLNLIRMVEAGEIK